MQECFQDYHRQVLYIFGIRQCYGLAQDLGFTFEVSLKLAQRDKL